MLTLSSVSAGSTFRTLGLSNPIERGTFLCWPVSQRPRAWTSISVKMERSTSRSTRKRFCSRSVDSLIWRRSKGLELNLTQSQSQYLPDGNVKWGSLEVNTLDPSRPTVNFQVCPLLDWTSSRILSLTSELLAVE